MLNKTFISEISSIESSDIYMSLKTIMFEADTPNKNSVVVSNDFINEVVANQDDYVGIPLVCDIPALLNGGKLTHLYNENDDTFGTNIIGSFYKFEVDNSREHPVLIGYCRIPKRDKEICAAITNLYERGELKFSFEISCSEYTEEDNGITVIDVSNKNKLDSLCVVSNPACEAAVALQMVAEVNSDKEHNTDLEANNMENEKTTAVVSEVPTDAAENNVAPEATIPVAEEHEEIVAEMVEEATEEIVAEQPTVQESETKEEDIVAEETEQAECAKPEDKAEDAEEEEKKDEEDAKSKNAEETVAEPMVSIPIPAEPPVNCGPDFAALIAGLEARIAELETRLNNMTAACRPEYASLMNTNFTSEVHETVIAEEVNPMVSDMTIDSGWTLLDTEEPRNSWTLV